MLVDTTVKQLCQPLITCLVSLGILSSVECPRCRSLQVSYAAAAAVSYCGEMNLNLLKNFVHTNYGANAIRFFIDLLSQK